MALALGATVIVVAVLLWEVMWPTVSEAIQRHRARRVRVPDWEHVADYDPGRELRAEQKARALLRSCVDAEDWDMYRDLGFLRVWGGMAGSGSPEERIRHGSDGRDGSGAERKISARRDTEAGDRESGGGAAYAYIIYPHKPIVAYLPQTGRLLNEYCVEFPDETRPYGSPRLPDSDDVLAKWMALQGDERRIISEANLHLPGRQIDPRQIQRDLWRLGRWERERLARALRAGASTQRQAEPADG